MKKRIVILTMLTFLSFISIFGQINKPLLIKTWRAEKFEEADGRQYSIPDEMKNDYLKFNSNGTYESLESGQLLIKGTWTLDTDKGILTMRQNQVKEYPSKIDSKIIKLTETELVMEAKDAEGNKLTVYSKPKK